MILQSIMQGKPARDLHTLLFGTGGQVGLTRIAVNDEVGVLSLVGLQAIGTDGTRVVKDPGPTRYVQGNRLSLRRGQQQAAGGAAVQTGNSLGRHLEGLARL